MRFKKVLLILPTYPGSHYSWHKVRPQVGMGYVSEALTQAGIDNTIVDMDLGYRFSDLVKKVKFYMPNLIGIGMMTYKYRHNYSFIQQIKEHFPEIKIIVGGPHISLMREQALKDCSAIDFGAVLEGEELMVELCKGEPLKKIKGLIHREGQGVVYNGDRPFIEDLDSVPFPKFQSFEMGKYSEAIDTVTTRGCPYQCTYCPVNLAIGRRFRYRSANNVVDEIEFWYRKGYRTFGFGDDNFTLIAKRVFEICDEIEKRGLKSLKLICGNGVRADKVTREMLKRMKEVGFFHLAFGVESGCERVLKTIKKGESLEDLDRAVKDACDLGFRVELFFLIGSMGETYEDVEKSFEFALRYPIAKANFYNIVPFPSTELFQMIESHDAFLKKPEDYLDDGSAWVGEPLFMNQGMTLEERVKALKEARKVRRKIEERYFSRILKSRGVPAPIGQVGAFLYSHDGFKSVISRLGMVDGIKKIINY